MGAGCGPAGAERVRTSPELPAVRLAVAGPRPTRPLPSSNQFTHYLIFSRSSLRSLCTFPTRRPTRRTKSDQLAARRETRCDSVTTCSTQDSASHPCIRPSRAATRSVSPASVDMDGVDPGEVDIVELKALSRYV